MEISRDVIDKLVDSSGGALEEMEVPVAAAVLDKNGNIVSICCNSRQKECSVVGHAEIRAIVEAEKKLGDWRLDGYFLVSTLEPCNMCYEVIHESRIVKVFYLVSRESSNIHDDVYGIKEQVDGFYEEKNLLRDQINVFFGNLR